MREIIFRGLGKEPSYGCPWVYGLPAYVLSEYEIEGIAVAPYSQPCPIQDGTLGQYTGLHDSTTWESLSEEDQKIWIEDGWVPSQWEGRMIFEGDIVKYDLSFKFKGSEKYPTSALVVEWNPDNCAFLLSRYWDNGELYYSIKLSCQEALLKVIGNIHQNSKQGVIG